MAKESEYNPLLDGDLEMTLDRLIGEADLLSSSASTLGLQSETVSVVAYGMLQDLQRLRALLFRREADASADAQ